MCSFNRRLTHRKTNNLLAIIKKIVLDIYFYENVQNWQLTFLFSTPYGLPTIMNTNKNGFMYKCNGKALYNL